MATIFAVDRSYLCFLILIIFFAASAHVGVHTFSVSKELERAHGFLKADPDPRHGAEEQTPSAKHFTIVPAPMLHEYMHELHNAGNGNGDQQAARQQILEIFADRLRAPVELGWYVVDILIRLGLIGTIIGFILIFASLNQAPQPDTQNIQSLLLTMSGGMGTALYTTLLGLISATLLGAQYMILGRSVEQLIAGLVRLGHDQRSDGAG
ncbi:MAG: MotA/TolQ/ExbB proton channel family protein [Rhizobiales bacterium]|nr:MotA/TolQ/ExbB proton channel family protein [Hyphomicrobiales bacterium]